jgi:hypothetical protein
MGESEDLRKIGRCALNPALHRYDDGHECRRFFSLAFAIDLGLEEVWAPEEELGVSADEEPITLKVYEMAELFVHPDSAARCRTCGKRPWVSRVTTSEGTREHLRCECEEELG